MDTDLDPRLQVHMAGAIGAVHLGDVGKDHALALGVHTLASHVVQAQNHVLRGDDDRLAVGGRQDVVGRHHQGARFQLRLQGQRHVHRHLVTVEVGVVRSADQRVQLDRLAFNQHGLKRLDTQTVQRRCTVQQHRVLANHFGEDIPDFRRLTLDHLLRGLDGCGQATRLKFAENEGLEQFQSHLFGQATLVQTKRGADHDHGTPRVVHALAQQVLPEAPLLALDHVGKGFQRALVGTGNRTTAAAVIQQCIHRFLQHALFVAHNDVGRIQVQQTLEAVVAVNHAPIQVIQV